MKFGIVFFLYEIRASPVKTCKKFWYHSNKSKLLSVIHPRRKKNILFWQTIKALTHKIKYKR